MAHTIDGPQNFKDTVLVIGVFQSNLQTQEAIEMEVDYATGVSPATGNIVRTQAEYDALVDGGKLKYVQDVFDILPRIIVYPVVANIAAGVHYTKPDNAYSGFSGYTCFFNPGRKFGSAGPQLFFYDPTVYGGQASWGNIVLQGEWDELEAVQSGTIAAGTGLSTITRDSGTWTPNEHQGKFATIQTGASAGQTIPISSNTATELIVSSDLSTVGACTFTVEEPATVLLDVDDAGSTGAYARVLEHAGLKIIMDTIQFGNTTYLEHGFSVDSGQLFFRYCVFSAGASDAAPITAYGYDFAQAKVQVWNTVFHVNTYVRIERSSLLSIISSTLLIESSASYGIVTRYGATLSIGTTHLIYLGSSAISLLQIDGPFMRSYANVLDGGGYATGLYLPGDITIGETGALVVNNCAVGVKVNSGRQVALLTAVSGTGNMKGWEVAKASRLIVNSPASLAGTTEIDVDGTTYTYSTDLPSVGSEIVGSLKSSMVRI